MANLFTKAKVAAKPAAPSKAKDKAEVSIPGLADLAAVDALMKSLAAIKETLEFDVKSQTLDQFKSQVANTGKIENFRGVDDGASASCEFRKRSSASALNEAEIELLQRFKVPVGEKTIVEGCFRVNPKYSCDSKLLEKISNAISKVKGVPEDFIEMQEEVSKTIVTDESVAVACKDSKVFDAVATVIGTLALKPKLDETDTAEIIEKVKSLIN